MDSNCISLSGFLFNVLCSVVASFIFIFSILIFLRPRIRLSPVIAKSVDTFDNNKVCYTFKIVNLSWFSAYAIEIELNELITIPNDGGQNIRYTKLHVKSSNISHLPPFRPKWLKPTYGRHALQIRVYEDIGGIVSIPLKSVQIEVTLRHGLTGLTKVFNQDYSVIGKVKEGQFVFGNCFDIV
jgi:hypothetical protein